MLIDNSDLASELVGSIALLSRAAKGGNSNFLLLRRFLAGSGRWMLSDVQGTIIEVVKT